MSQHWCQQNRPHPVFIHQSKQLTAERGTSHLVSWLSDAMLQTHIEKSTFNCIHQRCRDFGLGLSVVRIMQKICISLKFCKWQGLETVGWIWGWLSAVSVNTANAVEVGTRFLSIRYTVFPHELPAAKSPGKMVRPCKELWHCCHHQSAERQRYHSEEATRTVQSRGKARHQHTSSPDTETGHGCQVRAPT